MVLMETIVRPVMPITTDPSKSAPTCGQKPPTIVHKVSAPSNGGNPSTTPSSPHSPTPPSPEPKDPQEPDPTKPKDPKNPQMNTPKSTETTKTSSWSYAYKKYMTKKEKEKDDCKNEDDQNQVVGGTLSTEDQAGTDSGTTPGSDGSSGGSSSAPVQPA